MPSNERCSSPAVAISSLARSSERLGMNELWLSASDQPGAVCGGSSSRAMTARAKLASPRPTSTLKRPSCSESRCLSAATPLRPSAATTLFAAGSSRSVATGMVQAESAAASATSTGRRRPTGRRGCRSGWRAHARFTRMDYSGFWQQQIAKRDGDGLPKHVPEAAPDRAVRDPGAGWPPPARTRELVRPRPDINRSGCASRRAWGGSGSSGHARRW